MRSDEQNNMQRDLSSQDGSQDQQQFDYVAPDDDEYQNTYRVTPFAEGISEYDAYQQAWRFLGFMVDCNAKETDDDNNHDGGGGGSNDADQTGDGCKRYLLWAAYVDLEYEGSGIAEYQYYNIDNNAWDKTACNYADDGNSRCAKMDCHLDSTHFSLLGFFKHESYDDWMEQLFKHEGVCVWGMQQYSFMNSARESWPQGCSDSGATTSSGKPIYSDLKPISKGGMAAGLYTDTQCTIEYQSTGSDDPNTVENILGNFLTGDGDDHNSGDNDGDYDYSSLSFTQAMSLWEYGFEHFKVCQPCVAYNLNNAGGGYYDDDANQGGDNFDCYDQAGYTDVNQCMKFMAKTTMNTATFRDLSLAQSQGTLVDAPLAGFMDSRARSTHYMMESAGTVMNYVFLCVSVAVLFYGVTNFWRVRRKVKLAPKAQNKMDEPLVFA